ncbi:hypothetical protein FCM35_KLT12509 [Carex littledalei]|uniref:Secreted protein n=1 Tax=Carex littledalei TaxID=544730 RepID=A0A833QHI5_9POAL|nr:hypothetical protein FCM35_KLT12509 [Carex littledalei]
MISCISVSYAIAIVMMMMMRCNWESKDVFVVDLVPNRFCTVFTLRMCSRIRLNFERPWCYAMFQELSIPGSKSLTFHSRNICFQSLAHVDFKQACSLTN